MTVGLDALSQQRIILSEFQKQNKSEVALSGSHIEPIEE